MSELLAELAAVAGELIEPVVALLLTVAGSFVELNAVSTLSSGHTAVGLWMVYMGGIALVGGLFVVGGGLPRQLLALADSEAEQ